MKTTLLLEILLLAAFSTEAEAVSTYQIIPGKFTWPEAKADAETRGGHLATITSQAEWNTIKALFGDKLLGVMQAGFPANGTNLVTNGSFEDPVTSAGSYLLLSGVLGWTTTCGPGPEIQNHVAGSPFLGSQHVELDSSSNTCIRQDVATISGLHYVFSFAYSPRPGVAKGSNGIEALINGTSVASLDFDGIALSDTRWEVFSFPFLTVGASTIIEFNAYGGSDSYGGFVDDVRLIEPKCFVPAHSSDFENGVGTEWSVNTTEVTPKGARRFLCFFGNDNVRLRLTNLPRHSQARITFDLYLKDSWDGNESPAIGGPDRWSLGVEGGPTLLDTTFSLMPDFCNCQSYPDNYPDGNHPAGTGAKERNALGYSFQGRPMDAVYHLTYTFAHTADALAFNFLGNRTSQSVADESWGLDNVLVEIEASSPPEILSGPDIVLRPEAPGVLAGKDVSIKVRAKYAATFQWLFQCQPQPARGRHGGQLRGDYPGSLSILSHCLLSNSLHLPWAGTSPISSHAPHSSNSRHCSARYLRIGYSGQS